VLRRSIAVLAVLAVPVCAQAARGVVPMAGATTTWESQQLPFTTSGPILGSYSGVSCASATDCVAVGEATLPSGTGTMTPFVATLTDGSWTQGLLALPNGASSAWLSSISCTATQCQAVGGYTTTQTHALVESYQSGNWTATTGVDPSGSTTASLAGVSCSATNVCTAVGTSSAGVFAAELGTSGWSTVSLPTPVGDSTPVLKGVSCTAAASCVAVGSVSSGSTSVPLMESGGASTWAAATDTSELNGVLTSVGCNSSGACEAGGNIGRSEGLIESLSGGTWTGTLAGGELSSVWCTASGALVCTVWGESGGEPVIESLSGGTWTNEAVISPYPASSMDGSCSGTTSCLAFENLSSGAGGVAVLVQTPSGWTSSILPGPPDAALAKVSCTNKLCVGIATYYDDSGTRHTMLESLAHGAWTASSFPLPTAYNFYPSIDCKKRTCVIVNGNAAAVSTDGVHWTTAVLPEPSGDTGFLDEDSVSCATANWCLAVGNPPGAGSGTLVAETFTGGSWSASTLALPSGTGGPALANVSCLSTVSCVAAGSADNSSGIQSLVETLSGSTWTPTFLPPVSGATYGNLDAVSCAQPGSCTAVGSWYPSYGGTGDPLVAALQTGTWAESTLTPPGGDSYAALTSVACMTATACDAVAQGTGSSQTLSYTLEQLGVGPVAVPGPPGALSTDPESLACPSSTWCTLAGYDNAPFDGSSGVASYPMISSIGAPPITITSAAKATATVGMSFSFTVTTNSKPGDALTETGSLPVGFTFVDNGNDTATIAGTATSPEIGTYTLTVEASNGVAPAAIQTFKLKVVA
jgi:hypothetical protein